MNILAGLYKGRKLLSPKGRQTTRPMTAGAKKSLFSMLGDRVDGAVVVDLFCGTGTLGLEALSRGARMCSFADRDRDVLIRLRRNIQTLGADENCIVWSGDVFARLAGRLARLPGGVDLAFVDPPFGQSRQWSWSQAQRRLFGPLQERLAPGGTVVLRVEASVAVPNAIGKLVVRRSKRYGVMTVSLLEREQEDT